MDTERSGSGQWGGSSGHGRRGESEVLGAMFVFAILIATVGMFQVTVVPQTNEEVEFKHSTQMRADVAGLRAAMVSTGTDGDQRTVPIETRVDYPTKVFTLDSRESTGQLSTTGQVAGAIELRNVNASSPEAGDFWNGTSTFDSQFLVYRPSYNYYGNAPTTRYEPTVVYSSFRDGDVLDSPQSLVDGRTLNVVLVSGSLSQSGAAQTSVDVVPVSASTRTVPITDPGPLLVKTHLSEAAWQRVLSSEPNASVTSYTTNANAPNVVNISLAAGTWELDAAKVGMDSREVISAAYLDVEGTANRTINTDRAERLTLRVLDRYGNPVEGEPVTLDLASGTRTRQSLEDGTVTFYLTPSSTGQVQTTAYLGIGADPIPTDEARTVEFDLNVTEATVTAVPVAQQLNPGKGNPGTLLHNGTTYGGNDAHIKFRNPTANDVTVTKLRVSHYQKNGNNGDDFDWHETNVTTGAHKVGGGYASVSGFTVLNKDTATINIDFFADKSLSTPAYIDDGEFFVLTVEFDSGKSRTYTISPE